MATENACASSALPSTAEGNTMVDLEASGSGNENLSPHSNRSPSCQSPGAPNGIHQTNFMKYGTIRPPVSILQEEFLSTHQLWREHHEPLCMLDNASVEKSAGEAWASFMASFHTLHAHHHRQYEDLSLGHSLEVEPRGCEHSYEPYEGEQKVAIEGEKRRCYPDAIDEELDIEHLSKLIFKPGSKLSGITQTIRRDNEAEFISLPKEYELVVMEPEGVNELNGVKGILARHSFSGGEQCVYLHVKIVPDKEKETGDDISDEETSRDVGPEGKSMDGNKSEKGAAENCSFSCDSQVHTVNYTDTRLTIEIEYADGENECKGRWNHETLCFEGSFKKLSDGGQSDPNPMGGTIISGLISGRSSRNPDNDGNGSDEPGRNRMSSESQTEQVFLLSPCSHLHPRGIATLSTGSTTTFSLISSMTPFADDTTDESSANDIVGKISSSRVNLITMPIVSPESRAALLSEIASVDNHKLILHRSLTERLRKETLTKLVELGSLVDFAELARKRNVALRREKWRARMRKYTPSWLAGMLWSKRNSTESVSEENYAPSKNTSRVTKAKDIPFYDHLAAISWSDLLEEASIQTERTCAIFRRRAALLDRLKFESNELKAQIMADLRSNGLSLSSTHAEWDACIQMGRTVALGWSWFERGSWGCFGRSAVVGKRCVLLLFQMHSRLESNHERLEKAYRSADSRLTARQLDKLTSRPAKDERKDERKNDRIVGSSDTNERESENPTLVCAICHCDMEEADDCKTEDLAVFLPCSHCFHMGCIREWLHNHSQCPICRLDLDTSS